jgi:preprotein translocase subunit SecE
VTQTRGDTADIRPTTKAAVRTRRGPVSRIGRFIREVIAELGKVIWPTRKELVTYTIVVIVFVSVMVALVAGMDIGFAKVVLWVFG